MLQIMRRNYGYGYPGVDKEGGPVLVQLFGKLDVEGMLFGFKIFKYSKVD